MLVGKWKWNPTSEQNRLVLADRLHRPRSPSLSLLPAGLNNVTDGYRLKLKARMAAAPCEHVQCYQSVLCCGLCKENTTLQLKELRS